MGESITHFRSVNLKQGLESGGDFSRDASPEASRVDRCYASVPRGADAPWAAPSSPSRYGRDRAVCDFPNDKLIDDRSPAGTLPSWLPISAGLSCRIRPSKRPILDRRLMWTSEPKSSARSESSSRYRRGIPTRILLCATCWDLASSYGRYRFCRFGRCRLLHPSGRPGFAAYSK